MKIALVHENPIWNDASMLIPFTIAHTAPLSHITPQYQQILFTPVSPKPVVAMAVTLPVVPFYSQFQDITSTRWQKVGCGVTSLAMIINFYSPDTVSVNTLLAQGISAGAYLENAGWTYKGLIGLSRKYGLDGNSYDLGSLSSKAAFAELASYLSNGPVIASVHYKFDPKSTIPHLVVINSVTDGVLSYSDPAAKSGDKEISVSDFLLAWKKRFIVVRPVSGVLSLAKAPTHSVPDFASSKIKLARGL